MEQNKVDKAFTFWAKDMCWTEVKIQRAIKGGSGNGTLFAIYKAFCDGYRIALR